MIFVSRTAGFPMPAVLEMDLGEIVLWAQEAVIYAKAAQPKEQA